MRHYIAPLIRNLVLSIGLVVLISTSTSAVQEGEVQPLQFLATLQQTMENVQTKTNVIIGIPRKLPKYIHPEKYKRYIRTTVNSNFYAVGITLDPDCDGLKECQITTFIGSTSPVGSYREESDATLVESIPITLKNGDKAIYYDPSCGASCPNAELLWKHGRFYYMLDTGSGMTDAVNVAESIHYSGK